MHTLPLAIVVLLTRFSIGQIDVTTRQTYTMAGVAPDERSAAAERDQYRPDARLKLVYDFATYKRFAALPAAEKQARPRRRR